MSVLNKVQATGNGEELSALNGQSFDSKTRGLINSLLPPFYSKVYQLSKKGTDYVSPYLRKNPNP